MALLEVEDLTVRFYTEQGVVRAVTDLSYEVEAGETFGVVGESGAGKSVASLALLGLIDEPGVIERGVVRFDGRDLLALDRDELREVRGDRVAMVFQDTQTALNPAYTVGEQIAEAVRHHLELPDAAARDRAVEMLDAVGIPDPAARYGDYPHEFSGGMQQRAVIAMALSCDPDLLICDEPTTALDVTIEAQILELLEDLAGRFDTAIQLISHDLAVVAAVCDRVMVMYAGRPVEIAPVEDLYYDPGHPYTAGLMASIPRIGADRESLDAIPGRVPDMIEVPPGCPFHPRCPYAEDVCTEIDPALVDVDTGEPADPSRHDRQAAACHAHTGHLDGELGYEVVIEDADVDSPAAGPRRDDRGDGAASPDADDPGPREPSRDVDHETDGSASDE